MCRYRETNVAGEVVLLQQLISLHQDRRGKIQNYKKSLFSHLSSNNPQVVNNPRNLRKTILSLEKKEKDHSRIGMNEFCEILVKFTVANLKRLEKKSKLHGIAWRSGRLGFYALRSCKYVLTLLYSNSIIRVMLQTFVHQVNFLEKFYNALYLELVLDIEN